MYVIVFSDHLYYSHCIGCIADDENGGDKPSSRRKKTKEEEEEAYAARKRNIKPLENPDDAVILARIMLRSSSTPKKITLYLERLIKTESLSILRKFIACHGILILKHCVSMYEKKGNSDIVLMVWPLQSL